MSEFMTELSPWHWLILGMVLLGFEVLGTAGFLLGIALGALLQAVILFVVPDMAWHVQLLIFALSSVIFTLLYWRLFRRFNDRSDQPLLNDRAAQLVGRQLVLAGPIENGLGKIQIGDTLWRAQADANIPAGSKVEIIDSQGMVLVVRQID
ncbi:NfeD family protein [Aliamphritea spongicola]|uniref:NfeD family protein n=1 Tax=Aliamphritea spongicola TaxID=707589 RepID=UPI00196B7E21|nr:NfeD family protein [Aliamphritea spongicola]MBN3561715.1 NfeD family protein [Aliamphritea spongicola]